MVRESVSYIIGTSKWYFSKSSFNETVPKVTLEDLFYLADDHTCTNIPLNKSENAYIHKKCK